MPITATKTLSAGKAVVNQTDEGITIKLDETKRANIATVIELTVKGNAFDIEPVDVGGEGISPVF